VTINRTRSLLYSLARFLGNYQAVKNGKIGKRIASVALKRRRRLSGDKMVTKFAREGRYQTCSPTNRPAKSTP
jgi:hypothetical protein